MIKDIEGKKEIPELKQETTLTPDAPSPKGEVTLETRRSIARLLFGGFIKEVPDGRRTER